MTPGRRTAVVTALVAGWATAALPVPAAVPAVVPAAAEDQLVLSVDGTTWAHDVSAPLLDPDLVWVPGDVATGTLYARNVSGERATAAVTVHLDGGPDGAGAALVDELTVRTRMGSAPWTDGRTSVSTDLPPGAQLPIGVEVAFDPAATNTSQQRTAQIGVTVTLSGVGPGEDGGSGPGVGGPDGLPRTGANLLLPVLLAAGAIVLGMLLRRRTRHE